MSGLPGKRILVLAATSATAFAVMAAPAPAPVPPKNCGFIKAKGKRYNIKADVLRCRKARKVSRRYMTGGGSGRFTCQRYTGTNIKARCVKGKAIIYVIRR